MKFDMHCHCWEGSVDSKIHIRDYARKLKAEGFGGMLITDHDSYRGYKYWASHRHIMPEDFLVLKGIEYDTNDAGHFIVILPDGVDLKLLELRGMPVDKLVDLVHAYGGVLGPAHPYGMKSSSIMHYRRIHREPELFREFDFLEGLNTCEKVIANTKARELADKYDLQCTAGSDAHSEKMAGTAFTVFDRPITCNNDMIASIRERGIVAFGGKEREYRLIDEKRNLFAATWGFRGFNFSIGKAYAPFRNSLLKKALDDVEAIRESRHGKIV